MLWLMPLPVPADPIDDEYAARARQLQPNDIAGHLKLAKWCREQGK